uniref:Uncharacterized protein n=1 Tax=Opuntia streptacantha TaxID=393608 RepID=A0A7C9AAA0_OPUST
MIEMKLTVWQAAAISSINTIFRILGTHSESYLFINHNPLSGLSHFAPTRKSGFYTTTIQLQYYPSAFNKVSTHARSSIANIIQPKHRSLSLYSSLSANHLSG